MTEVFFYHLERSRLEQVLPELLNKVRRKDWKAVVHFGTDAVMQHMDSYLWTYTDESFLAHTVGCENSDAARMAEDDPIWMCTDKSVPNGADVLFLVDGAACCMDELKNFLRCIIIFDGADPSRLTQARHLWQDLKASTHDATYWQQSEKRGWHKAG